MITADNLNSHNDPLKPNQINLSDHYAGIIEIQRQDTYFTVALRRKFSWDINRLSGAER